SDGELNIQLYPLDATFEKIERWKEVHREKNIIPFQEEDINKHDWYEIGKTLKKIERKYGTKITDYIQDNTLNGVESAEELVRELEIGRASCRERGEIEVGEGLLLKGCIEMTEASIET